MIVWYVRTLVLTYHPAMNQFYEVLLTPYKHVLKSLRLHGALPSQTRVLSWTPKTIRDKLVLSKVKKIIWKDAGISSCGHSNFDICEIFEKGDQEKTVWKKRLRRKNTALIFHLIVTIPAYFSYWHAKYVLNST